MIKLIKISLISAVLATSGFATEIAQLQNGGEVEEDATIEFNDQTLTLAENESLEVYGSLTGEGRIECSGDGKVNVHINKYQKDDANQAAILSAAKMSNLTVHTLGEKDAGSISDDITVTPPSALNKANADLAAYASTLADTDLVYIANADGNDTNCVGNSAAATEISAALANADTEASTGFKPSGLVMTNKLKFSGDNSGFTQKEVTIGTSGTTAEVEYATASSIFPVKTTIEKGSTLTISNAEGTELTNNLTINGAKKLWATDPSVVLENPHGTLKIKGKLIVKSGQTLTLGSTCEEIIPERPDHYPQIMSWPVGSFQTAMQTLKDDTITDGIFTYTQETGTAPYVRTHTHPIDSTGKDLRYFPMKVEIESYSFLTNIKGELRYANNCDNTPNKHKYKFNGTVEYDTGKYSTTSFSNDTDFDCQVEGKASTGFYTNREKMKDNNVDDYLVAALFGTY